MCVGGEVEGGAGALNACISEKNGFVELISVLKELSPGVSVIRGG